MVAVHPFIYARPDGSRQLAYAYESAFGGFTIKISALTWVGNAVKTAGRAVGKVDKSIADETGRIGKALTKVPVVGGLLHGLFDSMFFVTFGPILIPEEVLISGGRIDKVALQALKSQLRDFKETGAYAQMVCSFIPGVGSGIAAAIGCGLALANGQPLSQAILAGVEGALPGGPLARMALDVAVQSVTAAAEHKKFTWQLIAKEGISAAASAIALPDSAKNALEGAFTCGTELMQGRKLGSAMVDGACEALPISQTAKSAVHDLIEVSSDVASGKRVDRALLKQVDHISALIPVSPDIQRGITAGLDVSVDVAQKKKIGSVLAMRLQHTATDMLLDYGRQYMPPQAKQAISIGMATAHGQYVQALQKTQLVGPVTNKLMSEGQQLLHSDTTVGRTYSTLVTKGHEGFQVGAALMRHQINTHQFLTVRDGLAQDEKNAFDIATSLHIGRVSTPPSPELADPTAQVGHFVTRGMQGGYPTQKEAQMAAVADHPVARVGAAVAINNIRAERRGWFDSLLIFLGLKSEERVA
jgi:hypothetical protein